MVRRFDPKLRFAAEMAARKQRRTVSSFIEWAVDHAVSELVKVREGRDEEEYSMAQAVESVWDVEEADRFAKLTMAYPDLLTHDEQVLWKLIRENGYLWRGRYDYNGTQTWPVREDTLLFGRLREHWKVFNLVALGELPKDGLPTWREKGEPTLTPERNMYSENDASDQEARL